MTPKPDAVAEPLIDHSEVETSEPKPPTWEPPGERDRRDLRGGLSRRRRRPR